MRLSGLPVSGRVDGRFRTSVSAAKNPVPGAEKVWWRELRLEAVAAGCALRLKSVNVNKWDQGWARPSRSICGDHSAGASRKVATPMPRGSRPSTAALTRAGAMNAIDIVMLTWRTLHFWRAAMASMLTVPETISSSQARPRAIDLISAVRRSAFIGRARDLAVEAGSRISLNRLGRRLRPGDQQRGV